MFVHCGAIVYKCSISLTDNRHINIVAHHCNCYNDGAFYQCVEK